QLKKSQAFQEMIWPLLSRILTSGLFGILAWNFARQPSLLMIKLKEKTKEILLANERFELATKATSDVIWDWNLETNEKYRSSQFSSLFGYSENEIKENKQFRADLIHPEDRERVLSKLQETLSGNSRHWEVEFRGRKSDHTYAYVSEKGFIIRNNQGKAIRMIGATQNITRQKMDELSLKQANERFELATRATSDVIWDWDLQSQEVYRSDQFATMFGYEDKEKVRNSNFWRSIIHSEDLPGVEMELFETLTGTDQYWQKEFRVKRADGTYAFIIDKGYIMRDSEGKAYRMIGSIQDISLRKENEIKLLEANQSLSNANEELKVFAALASHDMREPLRMISSFMSLLEKKYGANLDEKAHQYISFAMDGAKRLTLLINDLLEYSKVGFDQKSIEKIDTKELIEEVLELKAALIRENGASLILEDLPDIEGVKIPLKILFQNLIGNALKYKKPNSNPQIRISGRELKDFWEFSIEDNGIGIEPDYLEIIFGILKRLHPKEKYPGTGMGLATCRKIITQHGGKIWAESQPGIGSKFFFTITKHE
ncbi:MAG TPA: PAS domain-containing protein, partial [Algoriphagus sp.]|nr:PAS domain-containing protein [Algoriphagus sp.]